MTTSRFTVNIQKGGALLSDAQRLVEVWDMSEDAHVNLRRVAEGNLLGKATRRRLDDILLRSLVPRFVAPGTHVIAALKPLLGDHQAFVEAAYYETSRDETLLAAFAEGPCFTWYEAGRFRVTIDDTTAWLSEQAAAGALPGIVADGAHQGRPGTARCSSRLSGPPGAAMKWFAPPKLSVRGFRVYVRVPLAPARRRRRRPL